jgi:hypothetical protein
MSDALEVTTNTTPDTGQTSRSKTAFSSAPQRCAARSCLPTRTDHAPRIEGTA